MVNPYSQRLAAILSFLVADRNGLLRFLWVNVKNAIFPLATIYFILQFLSMRGSDRSEYLLFVYLGVFYVLFSISPAERVAHWFRAEQLRGTLETVALTRLSVAGTLRLLFAAHLLVYLLSEVPLFWAAAYLLWDAKLQMAAAGDLLLLLLLNLLLSFGLAQLSVALTLFFDASLMDLSLRKYTFNILSGVFCPVTMFPWWLQPVSYAIPFTHGLILLRRVLDGETGIPLVDFAPLAAFSAGLVIGGHLALEAVLLHIRRRRSLCRY